METSNGTNPFDSDGEDSRDDVLVQGGTTETSEVKEVKEEDQALKDLKKEILQTIDETQSEQEATRIQRNKTNQNAPIPPKKPYALRQNSVTITEPSTSDSNPSNNKAEKSADTKKSPTPGSPSTNGSNINKQTLANEARHQRRSHHFSLKQNLKEGFLIKRGAMIKNWKTRWFVLKIDGFYYFDNPKEWRPKSIVPISEISKVEEISESEKDALKLPENIKYFFFFKIISSKREFVCAATSIEERDDWVSFGNRACEFHLEQKNSPD